MKLSKGIFLIVATLALSACGFRIGGGGSQEGRTSENDIPTSSAPIEHSIISANIGASGGEIRDPENNVTINVPAGALSVDTNITVQYVEESSLIEDSPSMNFLGAVEFGPSGTTFDQPVQVTMKLTETPENEKVSIFCYDEEYNVWDFVTEADVSGNVATFSVNHFSFYKALDKTMSMMMKFHDLVKQAQATGQPDTWILQNFEDYLINEEHIMDIYALHGGYWYQPCGLLFGGNYHINGKEGDPNDLLKLIGKTNEVGNTYGLCKDASLFTSVHDFKQKEGKTEESQELILAEISVYYEMIEPDIELTASKKNIRKGETATIRIRCHYTNVQNFFEEFRDIDMDGYMLTIVKPTHFTVNKTAVVTNVGRADFTVTAKEDDVAETITVNFDVPGDHGVHSEGNVTLNSAGGYEITGHVKETLDITYHAKSPEGSPTSRQNGSISLEVEYDITGSFEINEGIVVGTIEYSNISIELASTPCLDTYHYDIGGGDSLHIEIGYNIFATHSASPSNSVTYDLIGSYDKTTNAVSLSYGSDTQIGKIEGTTTGYGETMGIVDADGSGSYDTTGTITSGEQSISEYVLGSGPQDFSAAAFLDNFSFDMDYDFSLDPDGLKPSFPDLSNQTGSTIKTIEISGMAPIE